MARELQLLQAVNASVVGHNYSSPDASQWYHGIVVSMGWHGMVSYGIVWYGIMLYPMVLYCIIWYGYMVWHGMVNASVASQRPSIKTATALPLQLLPEKPRNFEGNCFPCLFSLSHCQYFLQKMSQIYFNANIYCQKNLRTRHIQQTKKQKLSCPQMSPATPSV